MLNLFPVLYTLQLKYNSASYQRYLSATCQHRTLPLYFFEYLFKNHTSPAGVYKPVKTTKPFFKLFLSRSRQKVSFSYICIRKRPNATIHNKREI